MQGLKQAANLAAIPFAVDSVGGMFGFYFANQVPTSYKAVTNTNIEEFKKFFHLMLDEGVYLAPSAYEAGFTSIVHTNEVIDAVIFAAEKSFQKLSA
jgi:glutamate-1-semialdehyde 2,1-aminomutase